MPPPPLRRRWMVLVAAIAFAASMPGISNQFVQDDAEIIANNPLIHDLGNWREIVTSRYWPPGFEEDLYRPLTSLGLAVQYAVGGGRPVVFRLVSYLLYAACSVAFLLLAWRLFPGPIALGTAMLFAAHPLHVEAVALGVNQGEIGVGLLAALMLCRYLDRRRSAAGVVKAVDWVALGALYAGACLMKENALVLPGLLICAEVVLVGGPMRDRMRSLLPGYAMLAVIGAAVVLTRISVLGHFDAPGAADALSGSSAGGRLLTMLTVVPEWIRLLVWPVHLQADYSPQEIVASKGFGVAEAAGTGLVLLAAAFAWFARKRAPIAYFGTLWAAITLFPVSNLLVPTGVVLAERTLFLPSMGFLIAVGGLLGALRRNAVGIEAPFMRWPTVAMLGAITITGALRSGERQSLWKTTETFATRTAIDAPKSWRAQGAWAGVLYASGEKTQGKAVYQQAIALAPVHQAWRLRNELAECYFEEGQFVRAIEELRESQAAVPDKGQTWRYLILGYLAVGEYPVAARLADSALALGGAPDIFVPLRTVADSALLEKAPPGSIRIQIQRSRP